MAKRRGRKPTPPATQPSPEPGTLSALVAEHLHWMAMMAYAASTIRNRRAYLKAFLAWCEEREIHKPEDLTRPVLEQYRHHLYHHRKSDGRPLSLQVQQYRLEGVKMFGKWLAKQHYLTHNPAVELELPKMPQRLPRHLLSRLDVEQIINRPDVHEPLGLRDRAILETLYSTGIRRMELARLRLHDVDLEQGIVLIREGKGRKDRYVPIGERALAWLDKYLTETRPALAVAPHDEERVFLTVDGEPFSGNRLSELVGERIRQVVPHAEGACHLLRHAMATHMLEGGADIRYIQAMLGHSDLASTEIYTRVSIGTLKAVHAATHPAARLGGTAPESDAGSPEQARLLETLRAEATDDEDADA